jgi:hypothetical protein
MITQKTMEFTGPDIPQPDSYEALARLESAHEICAWFRRDKVRQMKHIQRLLAEDKRLTAEDKITPLCKPIVGITPNR